MPIGGATDYEFKYTRIRDNKESIGLHTSILTYGILSKLPMPSLKQIILKSTISHHGIDQTSLALLMV